MKPGQNRSLHNPTRMKRRLLYWLLCFFLAISLPILYLMHMSYLQLDNESWYQQGHQAQLLVDAMQQRLLDSLHEEQQRPIAEYSFFNVLENPLLQSTSVNFSPLSTLPPKSDIPGLIGYFQINPNGRLQIPSLPELQTDKNPALSQSALNERIALKEKLRRLLSTNISITQAEELPGKIAEKEKKYTQTKAETTTKLIIGNLQELVSRRLNSRPVENNEATAPDEALLQQLNIKSELWKKKQKTKSSSGSKTFSQKNDYESRVRKETVRLPDQSSAGLYFNRNTQIAAESEKDLAFIDSNDFDIKQNAVPAEASVIKILSFESEVSPMRLLLLKDQHLCFYRTAWHGNARYIQGFIVNHYFLDKLLKPLVSPTDKLPLSNVVITFQQHLLQQFPTQLSNNQLLLFHRQLLSPFQDMKIIINTASLNAQQGKKLLNLTATILATTLLFGFILFYRLGARQIELAGQQRNFISSVSHELKTPLTSIRMYAEMLRSNWINDSKQQQSYYDYIFFESERLSRLISNVLQLARLDNGKEKLDVQTTDAEHLLEQIRIKTGALIEAANFQLHLDIPEQYTHPVNILVDNDAFVQIMINLIDNAIKFSSQGDLKKIDIGYRCNSKQTLATFYVRDYGPGIDKKQMKKIFRLFYRSGDELTRTQPGTGIGLALVTQLAENMQATVDVLNRQPGAEFQISFNILRNVQ